MKSLYTLAYVKCHTEKFLLLFNFLKFAEGKKLNFIEPIYLLVILSSKKTGRNILTVWNVTFKEFLFRKAVLHSDIISVEFLFSFCYIPNFVVVEYYSGELVLYCKLMLCLDEVYLKLTSKYSKISTLIGFLTKNKKERKY